MTSLNFQLHHWGLESARFLEGSMETLARTRTSHWIIITAVCLGFRTEEGTFTRTSQSFSLFFLISLASFRNGSRWRTPAFKNTTPFRANTKRHPLQNRLAWLLHYLDIARLGGSCKWKAVFRKRGSSGSRGARDFLRLVSENCLSHGLWLCGVWSFCWRRCEWQLPIDSVSQNAEAWLTRNVIIYPPDPLSCQSEEK